MSTLLKGRDDELDKYRRIEVSDANTCELRVGPRQMLPSIFQRTARFVSKLSFSLNDSGLDVVDSGF